MKTPKLGKWIPAHRVRVVKVNGAKVLEIQRVVKKTPTKKNAGPNSKRKTKKAGARSWDTWMGAGSMKSTLKAKRKYAKAHPGEYRRPIKKRKSQKR